ncbi:MAG: GNAT family N-acetyltransferase [Pseudomonadales bacterium]|nr:GNAT family N-acetyltransferase [Pseudomonadales bacterium]
MNLGAAPRSFEDGVVRIRPPEPADAAALFATVDASRPELEAWMPWCTPAYDLADAQAWIAGSSVDRAARPFVIETREDGLLVGATGVDVVDVLDHAWKLGYWVRSDRTGRGIARRAAHLAARFAFEHLGAQRLDVLVAPDNHRSLAVAEALGARREGLLRRRFLLRGVRHDAVILGLLPDELRAPA